MSFAVGSLVRVRGREWVVLPDSSDELVMVRPLGGTEDETTGILTALEEVRPASFPPPGPDQIGDDRSARLLRDALRFGFRSSAGPFRSFGRIAVEPRPYQLVPLLMALRLDPVRLLIADDVGIGKTVEAGLVARELLDSGEADRLAVLCPPHLAEQWQRELQSKFHIAAELVLPSTVRRLERDLGMGQSIFEVHRFTVVSLDYIKAERRRQEFLRTCPHLVVVDEAHTCAASAGSRAQHLRHELVRDLARDRRRHLLLVTATPHSGQEDAFRSLLALLDPNLAELPDDLSGPERAADRRRVAQHFVQRRRADIRHFLDQTTMFPQREEAEETYRLTPAYRRLFERVLAYAREQVADPSGTLHQRRVRWWSALALLRCMASSPAAAAATLRARADTADTEDAEEADAIGRRTVLDEAGTGDEESIDTTPGSDHEPPEEEGGVRRRLREMAREADRLAGAEDAKLERAVALVRRLLDDGFHPIVFCRFIQTADYVAGELRRRLGGTEVASVTGVLPPAAREERVETLIRAPRRVLVATDCLSEGINLQEGFDAVLHYDLSWNPTRHEQREGRVDRYGQPSPRVRVVTYYGIDNRIDGIVLQVLLRKHQQIRRSTGVSVPVPGDPNTVIEAILEGLVLRRDPDPGLEQLVLFEEELRPRERGLFAEWERAADRERRSRTMFAQESIRVDEVARELEAVRSAIGSAGDLRQFVTTALEACGATVSGDGTVRLGLEETPPTLREAMGVQGDRLVVCFEPGRAGELLQRTDPRVEGLASWVLTGALDPQGQSPARRCGAIRTSGVARRTTLLLLRHRFHLVVSRDGQELPLLAEDAGLLAFAGPPSEPEWLPAEEAERLLGLRPTANLAPEARRRFVAQVLEAMPRLADHLDEDARRRARALLETHRRVREGARVTGVRYRVEPNLPPDVLGVYVYLPELAG
ncbi:MAG TPA: helicase-related protein [Candidatus Dormibacteraeota bacterium]|nr:helicase-related protein [Candidatus Dormibacteraeota bacterium]